MSIQSGALVNLRTSPDSTYQVVTIDDYSDSVWIRRWPLAVHRSATFVVSSTDLEPLKQGAAA